MLENWRKIKWLDDDIEVSDLGNFRDAKTMSEIKPKFYNDSIQEQRVVLKYNGFNRKFIAAKLVAMAFVKNEHEYEIIGHLNGDKTDNKASNIFWKYD